MYNIADNLNDIERRAARIRLQPDVEAKVRSVQRLYDGSPRPSLRDRGEWLELLASIDYTSKWKNVPLSSESELIQLVQKAKSKFNEEQIREAIRFLRDQRRRENAP